MSVIHLIFGVKEYICAKKAAIRNATKRPCCTTTKNSIIGRVSTIPVTVDTRPISHVYTVHVARRRRITVGRVYLIHVVNCFYQIYINKNKFY
jgi:hypothetical protein